MSTLGLKHFCVAAAATVAAPLHANTLAVQVDSSTFERTGYAAIVLKAVWTKPESRTVRWRVRSVLNRSQAVMPGFEHKRTGLSWNVPRQASGSEVGECEQHIDGATTTIVLYDVVGERDVIVEMLVTHANGSSTQRGIVARVGKGPLARFERPAAEPMSWRELFARCNGRRYQGNPSTWALPGQLMGQERMPGSTDLMSVSGAGHYNSMPAWGAALAVGWPHKPHRWWTSQSVMRHRARHIDIADGNIHGFGGADVDQKEFGVCLKPGYKPR